MIANVNRSATTVIGVRRVVAVRSIAVIGSAGLILIVVRIYFVAIYLVVICLGYTRSKRED